MRGEGEEEESLTLKPCKQGVLPYPYPLPFFPLSVFFLVKKRGNWLGFYIWGGIGKEKEKKRIDDCEIYTILDALEALYRRYRGIIKESLYKGLIGLNMSLYSSKGIGVRYIPYRVYG